MRDHAYHVNKGEQEFLRAGKAGETIGLHPITIRRWITSGKIQTVRVGIKAHTLQSEIEHFIGKIDARLLVLSACVSGHDQRPDLQHQIERFTAWAKAERPPREVLMLRDITCSLPVARKWFQQLLKLMREDRAAAEAVTSADR